MQPSSGSLSMLVRSILLDKKPEEVPMVSIVLGLVNSILLNIVMKLPILKPICGLEMGM